MFKKICSLMIFSFVAISSSLMAEIEYDIQDIGTLQTHSSEAVSINNQGQILGWYNIDGSANGKHFFVRNRDGIFHEIEDSIVYQNVPKKFWNIKVDWRYLTNNGTAYGVFNCPNNAEFYNSTGLKNDNPILFMWDRQNGVCKLGQLPGKEISAINNSGQILIKSIVENENGKSIRRPVIWENGKITKLHGLEGDIGIESEESYGFDMNNKGEVVGQSVVYLSYKNNIYKQTHAVKWADGQVVDLHHTIPKTASSYASAINDLGDVLINQGHEPKINNIGYVFSPDGIRERNNNNSVLDLFRLNWKIQKDLDSILMKISKIISVNDNGEIIAESKTIYGEQHAILLVPIFNEPEPNKNEPSSEETVEIPNQEMTKADLEFMIKNTVDAAFIYHTEGIEEKVRVRFLEVYDKAHPGEARMVQAPYRKSLMIEALDGVIDEIENLSVALQCEKNIYFWEIVQIRLKEKSSDWNPKVDAYIKIKTGHLNR